MLCPRGGAQGNGDVSYARSPSEGDVYVLRCVNDRGITCMSCPLVRKRKPEALVADFRARSPAEMLRHLRTHLRAGHRVPERAFVRLQEELS